MSREVNAQKLIAVVDELLAQYPPPEAWRRLVAGPLTPAVPFAVHRQMYARVYANRDPADGPAPAWVPTPEQIAGSNIGGLMAELGFGDYRDLHAWSVRDRDGFWETMLAKVGARTARPWRDIRDHATGVEQPVWLPGALLNPTDSCFQAPGDAPAIVSQQPGEPLEIMSYAELEALANRVANGVVAAGFAPGDALAIDMPMTPVSVALYLGVVRAGCAVISISDSFAPGEIAVRLRIGQAKGIFTQGTALYDKVVAAGAARAIVIGVDTADLRAGDLAYADFLSDDPAFTSVQREPGAATNILFSSGTTGEPKAIPWTGTTPFKCAVDAWLHHDIHPGDVLAWPTNLGWMMGPWLVYAALVNRATIALYGDAPTTRGFGSFVAEAGVTMLGVVPSLVSAWRGRRSMEGLDWSRIRVFSSTGECSNAEDMHYLMMLAGYKPIIEYCGGTEIGGGYLTGTVVQPAAPATFSTPALGLDLLVCDEAGDPAVNGEVFIVPPSIGLSCELLNHDHHAVYFTETPTFADGTPLRRHGDQIELLGGGYYRHHGRADDTMNLEGIKVSSAEIEQAVAHVDGVRETAAVAVPPPGGGPARLVLFAVPDPGADLAARNLRAEFQQAVRARLNPRFKVRAVHVIDALPRTASNKVMRRLLRDRCREDKP